MAFLSKEEYLKRYISGESAEDKKKKKRKKVKQTNSKAKGLMIVDDDVDFKSLLPSNLENTLEEDIGDNEPTVAEVVDERPDAIKQLEQYRADERWRVLGNSNKKRHDSDSDEESLLPNVSSGQNKSPQRRRHDSDSDQSPLREQRHDSDSDQSLPRRQRHDSDSDQSPPRKQRHKSDSDQSPPRKKRHDSDSDQSPPRKQRHDSESDQSPPRKKRHDSDSDQSPPRKKRSQSDSDQSPPRRKKHNSDSDQSPPRKRADSNKTKDSNNRNNPKSSKRKSRWNAESPTRMEGKIDDIRVKDEQGRSKKTLAGATAGLSTAKQMREEARLMKQREEDMYSKLDDEALGKNAKAVHRKRKDEKEEARKAEEDAKKAELQLKYQAWNKGLKQAELQARAVMDAAHEMSKPLTRHKDDVDLDAELKSQDREGDPMLAFIKKKKTTDSNKKELPRYKGSQPPPNRFNLWPGYRWDGVDRSNGFEKQCYAKMAEKKAIKQIAYKWSVEDM